MVHLGDITKINGAEIEPVDIITGGSPCQDLSIAGKRAGLEGDRSGLFMEQIRIVKEMREADVRRGRTGIFIRPRYLVWENVVGAFSSNLGGDFQQVLTEIIRIAQSDAAEVPLPEKGKWPGWDFLVGDGWSVAYRVHDAQFWGVPQRRRRICVLADFAGWTAPRILLDPELRRETEESDAEQAVRNSGTAPRQEVRPVSESLHGDSEQSGSEGEGTADGAESGADSAICLQGNGIDRADTAGCNGRGWRRGGVTPLTPSIALPCTLKIRGGV